MLGYGLMRVLEDDQYYMMPRALPGLGCVLWLWMLLNHFNLSLLSLASCHAVTRVEKLLVSSFPHMVPMFYCNVPPETFVLVLKVITGRREIHLHAILFLNVVQILKTASLFAWVMAAYIYLPLTSFFSC